MSKAKRPKRRDRFLASVDTLLFFRQDTALRNDVLDKLDWAMKNLRKEDRVLWVLGIVRRYHLVTWLPDGACEKLPPKDQRKRRQVLHSFDLYRIVEDYECLCESFIPNWSHFMSLTELHDSEALRSMPFNRTQSGKQVPLAVEDVLIELRDREQALATRNSGRHCTDGVDFIALADGWKWVRVSEGYSRQEAQAMGHCGNGAGRSGDILYSLREPVKKKGKVLWRPHLTFICKRTNYFGEMKGRANSKPSAIYHDRITELLKHPEFRGIRGGGYLPQNNFDLAELRSEHIAEIALSNPNFDLSDYRFKRIRVLHRFDDEWDLALYPGIAEPERPRKTYKLGDSTPMILFRRSIAVKSQVIRLPGLMLPLVKGYLGTPFLKHSISSVPDVASKFDTLLNCVEIRGVSGGSIFRKDCPWFSLLGNNSPEQIVAKWPKFASATPISMLANQFGTGPHLAHALSLQLGLEVRKEYGEEWTLARFRTVRRFLEGIRDYPNLRLFDSLKEGILPVAGRELRQSLLHRLREFRFDHSDIRLRLADPGNLGSSCSLTVSEAGLGRVAMDMEPVGVENLESFLLHLIRTYDYDRNPASLVA